MLYTVRLGYKLPGFTDQRTFIVEADRSGPAEEKAVAELKTQLIVEAMNVQTWSIEIFRGGGERRV